MNDEQMTQDTPQQPHEHYWRDTGKREVRYCEACRATEIKSLADLRWHPYISGDQVNALQQRNVAAERERDVATAQSVEWFQKAEQGYKFVKAATDRIVALEAALRKYGGHTASCYVGAKPWVCRCGLDALLSPSEAK